MVGFELFSSIGPPKNEGEVIALSGHCVVIILMIPVPSKEVSRGIIINGEITSF